MDSGGSYAKQEEGYKGVDAQLATCRFDKCLANTEVRHAAVSSPLLIIIIIILLPDPIYRLPNPIPNGLVVKLLTQFPTQFFPPKPQDAYKSLIDVASILGSTIPSQTPSSPSNPFPIALLVSNLTQFPPNSSCSHRSLHSNMVASILLIHH